MPSSWIRSMSAVQVRLVDDGAGEDGVAGRALEAHPLEQQAEAIADLAAEHELVVLIRRQPRRRAGPLSSPAARFT